MGLKWKTTNRCLLDIYLNKYFFFYSNNVIIGASLMPRVGFRTNDRDREECGRCYYSNNGTLTHHLPLQNRLRLSRNKTAQVGVSLRRLIAFNMHERTASVRALSARERALIRIMRAIF